MQLKKSMPEIIPSLFECPLHFGTQESVAKPEDGPRAGPYFIIH